MTVSTRIISLGGKTQPPTEKTRAIIEKMTAYISMFE